MDVQEIKDDKDDKDDNSFSKGAKEEEKGDTIMNFNIGKNQDKGKILQYNNTDINNVDNQNNFQDSHLKTENDSSENKELTIGKKKVKKYKEEDDNKDEDKEKDEEEDEDKDEKEKIEKKKESAKGKKKSKGGLKLTKRKNFG